LDFPLGILNFKFENFKHVQLREPCAKQNKTKQNKTKMWGEEGAGIRAMTLYFHR
jgi:hypothetical protein